jgi:hypothetical protein
VDALRSVGWEEWASFGDIVLIFVAHTEIRGAANRTYGAPAECRRGTRLRSRLKVPPLMARSQPRRRSGLHSSRMADARRSAEAHTQPKGRTLMSFDLIVPLAVLIGLVVLDILALRWGVDSRRWTTTDPHLPPRRDL